MNSDNNSNAEAGVYKKTNTLYIVFAALFTAIVFVTTMFLNIPAAFILGAGGNINLGDAVTFVAAIILGPVGGAIAGGLGAAGADLASAYIAYAPFTLIIKAGAGFLCGFMYKYALKSINKKYAKRLLSMLCGAAVIIAGYFFAEIVLCAIMGVEDGTPLIIMGLRTIVPNLVQVGLSTAIAMIVLPRTPELKFIIRS